MPKFAAALAPTDAAAMAFVAVDARTMTAKRTVLCAGVGVGTCMVMIPSPARLW